MGGPWDPARGLRCNPAKLLLDPYAKAISGTVAFGPEVLGQDETDPAGPSTLDSAGHVQRSLVVDPGSAGRIVNGPGTTTRTRSCTRSTSRASPCATRVSRAELRGTYAGLGHEAAIAHLLDLGVTTVELLPCTRTCPSRS